jgi:beta-lactamase class A
VPHASWRVADGATVLTAHRPERRFAAASMVKTFVLVAALEAVEEGELDLDRARPLPADLRCGGDGVLAGLALPDGLPLRDLLRLMIVVSDNTATNVVLEACGGLEAVNARIAAWGMATRVRSWVGGVRPGWSGAPDANADPGLPTPAGLGVTSALEHAALLDDLLDGRRLDALAPLAVDLLAGQQDRRALARWIGPGARFAHKTGTVDGVRHDGGVLLLADGRLSVTAFTDGGPQAEWPDHPACVGMGLAMAWTAEVLGLDLCPSPGLPPVPEYPGG